MTTGNSAETEQLTLLDNPPAGNKNSQKASSPTKSKGSDGATENGGAMEGLIIEPETPKSRCKCVCYWLIGIFLLCVFAGAVVILAFLILRVGGQPPVVLTTCGKVQGLFNFKKNHFSFMGIPYALPPVDNLRWQPPVLMSNTSGNCWSNSSEPWDASKPASQCVQRDFHSEAATGSEDCLYLNIFTPRVGKQSQLPVMVWLHGGDFDTGNASFPGFSPTPDLAKALGVVFVSIQFRLNAFGFLVLQEIANGTGNYGLQDQIAALNWIQENIANFGGNPNDVTIFGQGAGGSSVLALMVSPPASGLFRKAWSSSPSVVMETRIENAFKENAFFVNQTGCASAADVVQCLRGLSASDVLSAVFSKWSKLNLNALPTMEEKTYGRLVIDDKILPSSIKDAFTYLPTVSDVPLLLGNTAQEVDEEPVPLDIAAKENFTYIETIRLHLDTFQGDNLTVKALDFYPFKPDLRKGDKGAEYPLTTMVSDIRVSCPINEVASAASGKLESTVYRYVVNAIPSHTMHGTRNIYEAKYAFHGLDLMAFFQTMDQFLYSGSISAPDTKFSTTFRDIIAAFISTGKPSIPDWQSFNSTTAVINQTVTIVEQYHMEECELWNSHKLFKYGWKA